MSIPATALAAANSHRILIMHGRLWHRALPTLPHGGPRRRLIMSYVPTWVRDEPYGVKPGGSLLDALLADADSGTREVLGQGGYT